MSFRERLILESFDLNQDLDLIANPRHTFVDAEIGTFDGSLGIGATGLLEFNRIQPATEPLNVQMQGFGAAVLT